MATLDTHISNSAPYIAGATVILGNVFHLDFTAFLCAVAGAGIGLGYRPAPPEVKNKIDLAFRFLGNTGYILSTTIITCFAISWFKKYIDGGIYPAAFFTAFAFMTYRETILKAVDKLIVRKIDNQEASKNE